MIYIVHLALSGWRCLGGTDKHVTWTEKTKNLYTILMGQVFVKQAWEIKSTRPLVNRLQGC